MAFLDETGLAEVWALAGEKFGQVAVGSYTGTGSAGSSSKNSLTFDFEPKIVFITAENIHTTTLVNGRTIGPSWSSNAASGGSITTEFSGNTVTWYCHNAAIWSGNESFGGNLTAENQLNSSGVVYRYVAIG